MRTDKSLEGKERRMCSCVGGVRTEVFLSFFLPKTEVCSSHFHLIGLKCPQDV